MNRWVTSIMAFGLGLGGSLAAFASSESVTTSDRRDVLLGTPDVDEYCLSYGDSAKAGPDLHDPASWSCSFPDNRLFRIVKIDMDDLCTVQFGVPAFGTRLAPDDRSSWRCWQQAST